MTAVSRRSIEQTGGVGRETNSARAGLLPISLERAPLGAFDGIPVYLRGREKARQAGTWRFILYCSERTSFTTQHRETLRGHGVQFVYIPIVDQERFRQQTEAILLHTIDDSTIPTSVKSAILYETSVALVNELLDEPKAIAGNPRLEKVSRAAAMLVLNDTRSFSHLFATSHHDFYTATHMVNVGTWMVPLAYAMGFRKSDELGRICLAGLLHDVGKTRIPSSILNKRGRLSDQEWNLIRRHPVMGYEYLEGLDDLDPMIRAVVRQHHERLDGSGYPDGLHRDAIHPISRICAVIDSFDAMTALRPFKDRTMSVAQALEVIASEAPEQYDGEVVSAWLGLLRGSEDAGMLGESIRAYDGTVHRRFCRFRIDCPVRLQLLHSDGKHWIDHPGAESKAHNISRVGIGLLTDRPICVNETVRVQLEGRGTLRRTEQGLVMRCRAFEDGWHDVGIRFRAPVSEPELADLPQLSGVGPVDSPPEILQVPVKSFR